MQHIRVKIFEITIFCWVRLWLDFFKLIRRVPISFLLREIIWISNFLIKQISFYISIALTLYNFWDLLFIRFFIILYNWQWGWWEKATWIRPRHSCLFLVMVHVWLAVSSLRYIIRRLRNNNWMIRLERFNVNIWWNGIKIFILFRKTLSINNCLLIRTIFIN